MKGYVVCKEDLGLQYVVRLFETSSHLTRGYSMHTKYANLHVNSLNHSSQHFVDIIEWLPSGYVALLSPCIYIRRYSVQQDSMNHSDVI